MNPAAAAHDDGHAAALRGASLAFSKKPPAAPPAKKDNGALTAATSAGRARSPARVSQQSTGGSVVSDVEGAQLHHHNAGGVGGGMGVVAARLQQLHPRAAGVAVDPKSPSFIAATLAASRSVSPSPSARTPRRRASIGSGVEVVDSGSIAPTGSLISMFERGKAGDPVKKESPRRTSTETDDSLESGPVGLGRSGTVRANPQIQSSPSFRRSSPEHSVEDSPSLLARSSTVRLKPQIQPGAPPRRLSSESTDDSRDEPPAKVVRTPTVKLGSKPQLKPTPPKPSTQLHTEQMNRRPAEPARQPITQPKPKAQPSPAALNNSLRDVKDIRTNARPISTHQTPESGPKPKPQILSTPRQMNAKPMPEDFPKPLRSPMSTTPASKPKPKPKPAPLSPPSIISRSTPEVLSPQPVRVASLQAVTPPRFAVRPPTENSAQPSPDPQKQSPKPKQRPPTPPQPRGSNRSVASQPRRSRGESLGKGAGKPRPNLGNTLSKQISSDSASSQDTFVSASSTQSPERRASPPPPLLPRRRQSAVSAPPSPTQDVKRHRPSNASTSNLPLNSLTSAIMAGSLASSRLTPSNTGTSLPPPVPPTRHKSPRLLQTLRQPHNLSDDETGRHKKGHLRKPHRSGKHSHHEGSRKKWREEITSRERKRYEAVWASNRGLYLPQHGKEDYSQHVANVAVRAIWKRSRLPDDELIEVWDLVDREDRGVLSRQAFVVGMWLVDQRLRGRKIPSKVSDSVWGSANGVSVIKPKVK